MPLIENERVKLTATAVSGVAIATEVAGVLAPIIAVSYGVSGARGGWYFGAITLVWLFSASGQHLIAWTMLGRLKE